jgi:hypothetical protein
VILFIVFCLVDRDGDGLHPLHHLLQQLHLNLLRQVRLEVALRRRRTALSEPLGVAASRSPVGLVHAREDRNVDVHRRSSSSVASVTRGCSTICTSPADSSVIHAGTDTVDPSGRRMT